MLYKMKKFVKLSIEEKKLFVEAYAMLGMIRTTILTTSFKHMIRTLEQESELNVVSRLNDEQMETAKLVGEAIMRASVYTPWKSACLAQSLTAQKMLQKRGISGVFYVGVMKNDKENEVNAHAWAQCGDCIITGNSGHESFTVLSVFRWK